MRVVVAAQREAARGRPAHQHQAVIARVEDRVGGRDRAVREAAPVHEAEQLEHAPPHPHGVARVDAARVGALHVLERVHEAARRAVDEGGAPRVARRAARDELRQAAAELGRALGPRCVQCLERGVLAIVRRLVRAGAQHLEDHPLGDAVRALGEEDVAVLASGDPPEHPVGHAGHREIGPRARLLLELGQGPPERGGADQALLRRHARAAEGAGDDPEQRLARERGTASGADQRGESRHARTLATPLGVV